MKDVSIISNLKARDKEKITHDEHVAITEHECADADVHKIESVLRGLIAEVAARRFERGLLVGCSGASANRCSWDESM